MCGISGILGTTAGYDAGPALERLTAALAHRGPDGTGYRYLGGRHAGLGHRRLSIVDLVGGDQPMRNEDGTVWLVYNGEIYNHLALRAELERTGHQFRTRSDTEVIVHGWEEWGRGVLERLNGIYAFALFDGRAGAGDIWLARDPIGAKPLYVGRQDGVTWFASELGAAREAGIVDETIRPDAIDEYLVYRFVPAPGTMFRNTWKLPPGHFCRIAVDHPLEDPVFEPFPTRFAPAVTPRTQGEWEEALRDGLQASVRRQLMSDVPVGSLLSGGVDSTVVTRLMRDGLAVPPQAFAIGFTDPGAPDELAAARRAAAALGVPLDEVGVSELEYLQRWPAQIRAMGEPVANSGVLLLGLLCERVGRTHKVVLTGQGADEPLGGYPRHAAERLVGVLRLLSPVLSRLPERVASSDRVARLRRLAAEPDEARRFAETLAVFGPAEAVALTGHGLDPDALVAPVRRWLPEASGGDSLNRLLQTDARLSLADDLLTIADRTSMQSSVELRVPFLDLEFLALVDRMPGRYKVSALGERKWLYRRAVGPLLPDGLRRDLLGSHARLGRKLGFSTPLDRWFGKWVERDAERYLLGADARLPGVVAARPLRALLEDVRARGLPRARQLMSLYVLECWLRSVGSGTPELAPA
jgi:asparagine synthase (glutamine-hydrolysing)